ncbi:MAG TPA: peptide deformylase [Clostridia bacterium]|nr:peptide deformylase [Clostridia bacterium]
MAILEIRKDEDPILRKKSKKIKVFDDKLQRLAEDMIETMHEANGVGLAAVQTGRLKQIITLDLYDETGPKVFVNPEIFDPEGEELAYEACLSVTDITAPVPRPISLRLKAQDLEGNPIELEAKDLLARILCHEVDHLKGILFTDKAVDESLMEDQDESLVEDKEEV